MRQPVDSLPSALDSIHLIEQRIRGKRVAVFLDYDGTLTPIAARPELAVLSDPMRRVIRELAARCPVAVVSGRDRSDVQDLVAIDHISFVGSHGFDIVGPDGEEKTIPESIGLPRTLDELEHTLQRRLQAVPEVRLQRKKYSLSVHYRQVPDRRVPEVERIVDEEVAARKEIRKTHGKRVFEIQPRIDWHKGKAVLFLLELLDLDEPDTIPIYVGDDLTDENAFLALRDRSITVHVKDGLETTAARYTLESPDEVGRFLAGLTRFLEASGANIPTLPK
jgi:trehalose 6-phosphate phosphatase